MARHFYYRYTNFSAETGCLGPSLFFFLKKNQVICFVILLSVALKRVSTIVSTIYQRSNRTEIYRQDQEKKRNVGVASAALNSGRSSSSLVNTRRAFMHFRFDCYQENLAALAA